MNESEDNEEVIFEAARQFASRKERRAYLAEACGNDSNLRRRIEDLLEADAGADEIFKTVVSSDELKAPDEAGVGAAGIILRTISEQAGDRIGRYKLFQEIGEGGCGVVYM